jgi:hypothetical protein
LHIFNIITCKIFEMIVQIRLLMLINYIINIFGFIEFELVLFIFILYYLKKKLKQIYSYLVNKK